jgi:hypothetical protein
VTANRRASPNTPAAGRTRRLVNDLHTLIAAIETWPQCIPGVVVQVWSIAPLEKAANGRPAEMARNETPAKRLYSPAQTQILDLNCSRIQSNIAAKFNRWIELNRSSIDGLDELGERNGKPHH